MLKTLATLLLVLIAFSAVANDTTISTNFDLRVRQEFLDGVYHFAPDTDRNWLRTRSRFGVTVENGEHQFSARLCNEFRNQLDTDSTFNEDELKKLIDKIKENLTTIRDNNLKFREKKNLLEKIKIETKHNESLKQEIIKIDLLINNEKNELEKIKKSSKEFETLDEKYQEQKIILNDFKIKGQEIEIRLSALNQEYSSINEQIKLIDTKIETFKKTKEKIKNLNEIQNWFDSFFVKLMSTIEKHVMVSIHKEFNSLLKEWFAILIQDIDISLDDEFAVSLLQDGYEADIGSLSGGEKTSVALAYRLALNKVVNDLIPSINTKDLIILDEPTDGFSSEQLDKVRDVIEELNMKQTIIVSHEPKMESYVENIIRIAKSDGISRIV